MDMSLTQEKLNQAVTILPSCDLDCWLLLGRETGELCDPSLPLIFTGAVTWQSAFLIHANGEKVAIVGRYDVANVEQSGGYTKIIGYDEDMDEHLLAELTRLDPKRIGLNFSRDNHTSDGLTVGMYLCLLDALAGTPYRDRLTSADRFAATLRGRKADTELSRIQGAIELTVALFDAVPGWLSVGLSERMLQERFHTQVDAWHVGTAWERLFCPIVNFGPDSLVGHAAPGNMVVAPGQVLHIDFGIRQADYCADLQRCWYIAHPGEQTPPSEVLRAFETVVGAITAAASFLRPGRIGAEVDAVARDIVVGAGYTEYKHALGHQVGRLCHDGSTLLGPRWARYGNTVENRVEEGEVYTLELGVMTLAGLVSIEEMVVITADGCRFLTAPQQTLPIVLLGA
jgi:Xaa-Pro aminopeptidase